MIQNSILHSLGTIHGIHYIAVPVSYTHLDVYKRQVYDMLEDFVGHHPDMSYVILERFQTFIPYSHKIPSNLKSQLERGKYYEFTYHIKGKGFIDDIDDEMCIRDR